MIACLIIDALQIKRKPHKEPSITFCKSSIQYCIHLDTFLECYFVNPQHLYKF